jgi:hypothetical protein
MAGLTATMPEMLQALHGNGFDVVSSPVGGLDFEYRKDGLRFTVSSAEWNRWDGFEALCDVVRKKLDAARAEKKAQEQDAKLAALDEHQRRRTVFYEAESAALGADPKGFRPEEPNVRVYYRAVDAAIRVARDGLSRADFASMLVMLNDEYSEPKKTTP